ncbi:hypothetical protein F5B20DRAFT_568978 [Whalleya microplaca]|nr:hypothetical protein F5B20DRAFT_568978 [Whalleya microplaca]
MDQATVIEADSQGAANTIDPTSLPPPLSLRESLSTTALLGIIGGQIVILGTVGFLGFLWFGHGSAAEGAEAQPLWRLIALEGWMIRTITLCALVLQFIVSVQSVICTSMIAALVLEKHYVRKSQVAWFSIMRSINDGPRQLIQLLLSSKTSRIFLTFELWLLIVAAVVALGLQFASTILLSDLHDYVVVGDVNSTWTRNLVSYEDNFVLSIDRTWIQRSPVYAAFGEVQTGADATPDMRGYSDTGLIQRGLLPITTNENRTSVRSYSGNAIVMNSQVACVRPKITGAHFSPEAALHLLGTLHYIESLEGAGLDVSNCDPDNCKDREFICSVPTQVGLETPSYQSSLCLVSGDDREVHPYFMSSPWNPSGSLWAYNSSAWLVFASNIGLNETLAMEDYLDFQTEDPTLEWTSSIAPSGRSINVTLCFSGYDLERKSVKMSTSGTLREPTANWSLIAGAYDTTQVQNYMGATQPRQSHQDRYILDLSVLGEPNDGNSSSHANSITPYLTDDMDNMTISALTVGVIHATLYDALYTGPNRTYSGCWNCYIESETTNPEYGMLFTDIISTTGRTAVALQSYMSILAITIYEAYINSLPGLQESQISRATVVPVPGPCSEHTCSGFVSVTVLLGVHLVCVVAITVLYVRQVRYSRYANEWHAVSQLVNPELADILDKSNAASDSSVVEAAKADGSDIFVRLGVDGSRGKVETVKYVSTEKAPTIPEKPRHWRMPVFMKRWVNKADA